jgi:hypothetical protein
VALVSILSIHTFIFLNIYCTLVILLMLITMTLQLLLVMYLMNIKLNPISCVLIVNSSGIYIHFISYICLVSLDFTAFGRWLTTVTSLSKNIYRPSAAG